MLIAIKDKSGVIATEAEKGHQYFCPECNEEVVLKKGKVITHHFSHKSTTECPNSKPESKEHLRAKILIYNWCRDLGMTCYLEHPIETPNGRRRADIYVESFGKKYAIEIQKSPQSMEDFERRTESYRSVSVHVIWVPMLTTSQNLSSWQVWAILAHNNRCWFWEPNEEAFWFPNIAITTRRGKPMFDWAGIHRGGIMYRLDKLGLKPDYSDAMDIQIHKPHSPGSKAMRVGLIEGILGSFYVKKGDDIELEQYKTYQKNYAVLMNNTEFIISYWSEAHSVMCFDWRTPPIEIIRLYHVAKSFSDKATVYLFGEEVRTTKFMLDKKIGPSNIISSATLDQ